MCDTFRLRARVNIVKNNTFLHLCFMQLSLCRVVSAALLCRCLNSYLNQSNQGFYTHCISIFVIRLNHLEVGLLAYAALRLHLEDNSRLWITALGESGIRTYIRYMFTCELLCLYNFKTKLQFAQKVMACTLSVLPKPCGLAPDFL